MTAVHRLLPFSLHRAARVLAATAAALALAVPAHAADTAPAWNLDRLMSTLAQHKSGRATFTETKYLSIATQPVESSGELVFVAPDHLEKHTLSPKPEHLVVDGDMLTVERNNRKFTLALARYPELGAFIDSIRATLAGNRFALEQVYKVALSGRGDDWTLTLTPLDSRMLKVVSTITLDGTRDVLRRVAIQQADGDHSVMRLQPVAAAAN
ncbi:MAG: outer membrane lipoprotein carrier protein LolA [Burkholderia sp.]|jgi:outer membrane lipoprotein-sorting protein|uniref:outer membrane lipoprotein carrier protein LolA n=1 Tax=Burkholderia TaxID=32008 RepID=UPI00158E443D|nr:MULTISPECIES: outer membrane lipoprotein carrier protein LolA [Burkholderia]MBY8608412.1 outer membrane lipoprotein carrier protein LolA [Burkholderia arboris]MCA3780392.1 outer membrane lipoprotein carrier protein LolA [Burkholderia sp.]MCA3784973.1 outer membrane lipoprotein carrier protein LolA [Burkholderia sp.]MCA3791195.1 outer membrane lipoprotein carrier protein LolA [Burkholderia sp.]MCA3800972.1 outer membrane lipoprotein carrier protein LolA [Burkholderia sp.]